MAQWIETYQKMVHAIQGTGGAVTAPGSIRNLDLSVYVTDDYDVFRACMFTTPARITTSQFLTRMNIIKSHWTNTSAPNEIAQRCAWYKNHRVERISEETQTMLVMFSQTKYDPVYKDAFSSLGYNVLFYSLADDEYKNIGTVDPDGFNIDQGAMGDIVCSNASWARAMWSYYMAYRNPDEIQNPQHKITAYYRAFISQDGAGEISWGFSYVTDASDWKMRELNCRTPWKYGDSPYTGGGTSEGEGGPSSGSFDWNPDDIPVPDLPTYSSVDTGFTRIYNPTLTQLQDFAAYMWTDTSIWSTIWNKLKQYFEDPMDAFIALNILPCEVPNASVPETVKICFLSTGRQMYPITNQFVKVDCGSVNLEEIWGSALDYSPNTKIDLFLPFVGTVPIDPDEVMGHTVMVQYTVDVVTGNCLATVSVNGSQSERVLYQFSGHCAISIPFSSADFSAYVSAAISAAKAAITVGAAAATAGAAGALGAGAPAAASGGASSGASSTALVPVGLPDPNSGAIGPANSIPLGQPNSGGGDVVSFGHLGAQKLDGVGTSPTAKPSFTHTGGFTGNTGFMGVKYPYFIIKSPRMVNPDQYGQLNGYPSMVYTALSACTGFTQVQQIHLGAIDATANERDEIISFLKSGVIL